MGQGGARAGAGRKKVERATDPGLAERVLKKQNAEALWTEMVQTELKNMRATGKTAGLRETLVKLECRAYGDPVHNLNHMHDKPLEVNHHFDLADKIAKGRSRLLVMPTPA
jgi:hypothetical protein